MIWDYGNMLPDLLFICGNFHYLQIPSKNTGEKCVPFGAQSIKAEVRRNTLFLLMQFYRELGKKRSHVCMLLRSRLWLIIQRLLTLNEFKFILLSFRILRFFYLPLRITPICSQTHFLPITKLLYLDNNHHSGLISLDSFLVLRVL